MTPTQINSGLKALGWLCRNADELHRAIEDFQRGWFLGDPLAVDGNPGPNTQRALTISLDRLKGGQGTASAHFSYREWRCGCGGSRNGCRVIVVHRPLLADLEVYRAQLGHGVTIASGYRCPLHNADVGGAKDSQHLYGGAADVAYDLSDVTVAKLRRFSGIGRSEKTHLVRHVDVRHLTGHNSTGGTPDRPTIWNYAQ